MQHHRFSTFLGVAALACSEVFHERHLRAPFPLSHFSITMLANLGRALAQCPSSEVLTGGVEVVDQLASEWRRLCEDSAYDAPFYQPEWIAAYLRAFAPDKCVVLATARARGRLLGVLPLVRETGLVAGIPVRKLRAAGNVHTCRFDLVHRTDSAGFTIPAIWNALLSTAGWDVLELSNVPIRGAAAHLARHAQDQGYGVHVTRGVTSPYIRLSTGNGAFDELIERLDPKFRSNLRRRMRKLEMSGPVELVVTRKADELLRHFYELERTGWKGTERSAIACSGPTRAFYDAVAAQSDRSGDLSLYALECAGRRVAMFYGLHKGTRYFLLKTAYDESMRHCSPGQLITQKVLQGLLQSGCKEFDFLGLPMGWKKDWAPRLRPHANWYVFRGPIGRISQQVRFKMVSRMARSLRAWARATSSRTRSTSIADAS